MGHGPQQIFRASTGRGARPTQGSRIGQGRQSRRAVCLCRSHHRHLLPGQQRVSAAAPRKCAVLDNASDAEAAGLRPSTRSAADQTHLAEQHAALVARACRQIADAEQAPSLNQLAELAGMSPWHFHRVFKTLTGVTPKAYASAHRADRIRTRLADRAANPGTITDAVYDAGFSCVVSLRHQLCRRLVV